MAPLTVLLRAAIAASFCVAPLQPVAANALELAQGGETIGPRATQVPDPEGEKLVQEFGLALRDWSERRMRLSRGGATPNPKELGPHPALAFRERFQALLALDSGWAQCWWLDNLQHLTADDDLPGRKRVFLELYGKLLARNASQPYMMNVLGAVKVHRLTIGESEVDGLLERLADASTNPEIQARATNMRAGLRTPKDPAADPARMEEALEIHRMVVANWPQTAAAKDSASMVLPGIQREFEQRERDWLEQTLALQKRGVAPSEWPAQPIREFEPRFLPLAKAGLPAAGRWMNRVHNPYVGLESQGPAAALGQLALSFGSSYPVQDADTAPLRLGLFELLARQFPDEPATQRVLDDLMRELPVVPAALAEARFAPLIASADPHRRAIAFHLLARTCSAAGRWPDYLAALAWSERMARECPGDPLLERTQRSCATVQTLMPGQPAPEIAAEDLEKKWCRLSDYKGRVVMLAFYNLFIDQGFADVAQWQDFASRNAARPFSLVGVNPGSASIEGFYAKYAKLGISWRTLLPYSTSEDVLRRYMVAAYPTVIVIDAEGKLRGRDLSWDETKKLIETCIAEAEAKGKK